MSGQERDCTDYDCIVVGGGPAGLTAAIYLSRFHLKTCVVDAGDSRALWIPRTYNHAGYRDGISGKELLSEMCAQAEKFGATLLDATVTAVRKTGDYFELELGEKQMSARVVLLATGVTNNRPNIDDKLHRKALAAGNIRYCAICDGFEVTDKNVAVLGSGDRGMKEAIFLRSYTAQVTLIAPMQSHELTPAQRNQAKQLGLVLIDGPCEIIGCSERGIMVSVRDREYSFDTLYPALGSNIHSQLAIDLGAETNDTGCISVDDHQRTTIKGLYAAGDVVIGLDQISHAMGEGGVAATTMRNDLAEMSPLLRLPVERKGDLNG